MLFLLELLITELVNLKSSLTDPLEDEASNYPQGLVLVPRGAGDDSVVVGSHIRGSRLRASAAGDEEVDLLLPGTARYGFFNIFTGLFNVMYHFQHRSGPSILFLCLIHTPPNSLSLVCS